MTKPYGYLVITSGNSTVSFYINGIGYSGYSLRDAIKKYRELYGLQHKRLEVIDLR